MQDEKKEKKERAERSEFGGRGEWGLGGQLESECPSPIRFFPGCGPSSPPIPGPNISHQPPLFTSSIQGPGRPNQPSLFLRRGTEGLKLRYLVICALLQEFYPALEFCHPDVLGSVLPSLFINVVPEIDREE